MKKLLVTVIAIALAAATAHGETLLENETLLGGGRAVSWQWTIFQPFTVPEPGWHVTSIGVDGFVSFEPLGQGMLGTLMSDDGLGNPEEAETIAGAAYFMNPPETPAGSQWVDATFDVELPPGRYWMRWSAGDDIGYFGTVWRATSGEPSFSRNEIQNYTVDSDPTALRIMGHVIGECLGDGDGSGVIDTVDLLGMLAAWGTPSATYDIALGGGDGTVDVQDLLALLAGWGDCPA